MRIGELARTAQVNTKTIRFYEQAGLLPEPARTSSGYRDYTSDAAGRLVFIRSAQAAGLTLTEIRDVLTIRDSGHPPCGHVAELIGQRLSEVRRRIADLRTAEADLRELKARAASFQPTTCTGDAVCGILSN
ncbi:heavy metal-responsive transcriptional regulator [Amycolatopsis sp. NBC_00345]|uniref:heavy metal-responsive transcriptional regulator n=1 Tax=Amycolatopsis sp. NBC_00345 TaxID=2975955 RepID=UPI002E2603CB